MTRIEFVSEHKYNKTNLRMKTDPIWKLEKRALSTIEELSEQEVSESEVENFDAKSAKHLPGKNPCIVTIGTEIIEMAGISRENSLFDETVEEDQVASTDNVNSVWSEWTQNFTVDQFLFSLILGLIPTAWDVFSDLSFGADLASTNEISAAGHNFKVKSGFRVSKNAALRSSVCQRYWRQALEPEKNHGDSPKGPGA